MLGLLPSGILRTTEDNLYLRLFTLQETEERQGFLDVPARKESHRAQVKEVARDHPDPRVIQVSLVRLAHLVVKEIQASPASRELQVKYY